MYDGCLPVVHRILKGLVYGGFWAQACKHVWIRMVLWIAVYTFLILGDEYLKEGYLFHPREVYGRYITHEKLLVYGLAVMTLVYLVLGVLCRLHSH